MADIKQYIQALFAKNGIVVKNKREKMFDSFINEESNNAAVLKIFETQSMLMAKWRHDDRVQEILEQTIRIPNATVGKPYEAKFDFIDLKLKDVIYSEFEGLEAVGLGYNNETEIIKGVPVQSGDFKIKLKFRIEKESDDQEPHVKEIVLIINPDPKSLWQNKPSDPEGLFAKPDIDELFQPLGNKHVVVASHRGRSHANVGSYRDDDFSVKHLADSGWSIVAVSDGAGSAKVSRQGSVIACKAIIDFYTNYFTPEKAAEVDGIITDFRQSSSDESKVKMKDFIYTSTPDAAKYAHKQIEEFALKQERPFKDFHATLIFALFKKYDFGYVVLTFGVGDCPIAVLYNDDGTDKLILMNWLDVGEFGGGTRFITMPEIFTDERKLHSRVNCKIFKDFSYLMLMTDGIYDPKFVVEASLEKLEKWKEFMKDLDGENEDHCKVEFSAGNTAIASQLSKWMEFWSAGNHDDRTLAIVF